MKDLALFGGFPTQESVEELESNGVRCFVNLTYDTEKRITPYKTKYKYIHYPIIDSKVPVNLVGFAQFIIKVSRIIKKFITEERRKKVYIGCKGGHGRSGLVVACLLCYMYKLEPYIALQRTNQYHSERKELKEKWRIIGSPQTMSQKLFVYRFFENLNFYRAYKTGCVSGFSTFSLHKVYISDFGLFPTAEAAFQAYKDYNNDDYVKKQELAKSPILSRYMGNRCNLRDDWVDVMVEIMEKILILKFKQNPNIKKNLLNTGLRPIIYHNRIDGFWGDNYDGKGSNIMGCLLSDIRDNFYEELSENEISDVITRCS
jgi:ribA/ribD-fused uncharacterized protein